MPDRALCWSAPVPSHPARPLPQHPFFPGLRRGSDAILVCIPLGGVLWPWHTPFLAPSGPEDAHLTPTMVSPITARGFLARDHLCVPLR